MHLLYDPTVTVLSIYPREMKAYIYTNISKQIFIAALFRMAPNWKQPKSPSTGEGINNSATRNTLVE